MSVPACACAIAALAAVLWYQLRRTTRTNISAQRDRAAMKRAAEAWDYCDLADRRHGDDARDRGRGE